MKYIEKRSYHEQNPLSLEQLLKLWKQRRNLHPNTSTAEQISHLLLPLGTFALAEAGIALLFLVLSHFEGAFLLLFLAQLVGGGAAFLWGYRRYQELEKSIAIPLRNISISVEKIKNREQYRSLTLEGTSEIIALSNALNQIAINRVDEAKWHQQQQEAVSVSENQIQEILNLSTALGGSIDIESVSSRIGKSVGKLVGSAKVVIWSCPIDKSNLHAIYTNYGSPEDIKPVRFGEGSRGIAAKTTQNIGLLSTKLDKKVQVGIVIPMVFNAESVGLIEVKTLNKEPLELEKKLLDKLQFIGTYAATTFRAAQFYEELQLQSERDGLTKIYNRKKLDNDLKKEFNLSKRQNRPMSFVMLDVDFFKKFNDTYSHQVGDVVLQEVGKVLEASLRETDTCYRYGGEEFSIILRETNAQQALEVAERVRKSITKHFSTEAYAPVTISLGVAECQESIASIKELIERADSALYKSKESGRNCSSVYQAN